MNTTNWIKFVTVLIVVAGGTRAESFVPCWQSAVVAGDPVLFVQAGTEPFATALLLRIPEDVPELRSASGEIVYVAGRDFDWKRGSRELRLLKRSRIPFRTTADLYPPPGAPNSYKAAREGGSWLLFGQGHFFHDLQCAAYHRTRDDWHAPEVRTAPDLQLSRIRSKLKSKTTIRLAVLDDSISSGLNASVTGGVAPHQEGYPGLLVQEIERGFGGKVVLAVVMLDLTGNSLNHPNDFGHRIYADVILSAIGR